MKPSPSSWLCGHRAHACHRHDKSPEDTYVLFMATGHLSAPHGSSTVHICTRLPRGKASCGLREAGSAPEEP